MSAAASAKSSPQLKFPVPYMSSDCFVSGGRYQLRDVVAFLNIRDGYGPRYRPILSHSKRQESERIIVSVS